MAIKREQDFDFEPEAWSPKNREKYSRPSVGFWTYFMATVSGCLAALIIYTFMLRWFVLYYVGKLLGG